MRARWPKDFRFAILLGATLLGLGLAWSVKAPCIEENWDGHQYERLCYNDIQPLYRIRYMHERVVPYVDDSVPPGADPNDLTQRRGFLEYPVLTGIVMFLAAQVSTNGDVFLVWNAIILSAFAMGATVFLYKAAGDKRRVAFFALGPPLFLYAFHNWDLIAVFFTALALYFQQKNNALGAGIALGLGASAKMFPAFLAPAFGLFILRRERRLGRRSLGFGLGFVGAVAAANLPFFLANRELFLETYRFHLRREPNFETVWFVASHYGQQWGLDWLSAAAAREVLAWIVPLCLLAGLSVVGFLVWRGRLDAVQGGFASLLLFMMFNKIFSVQYSLWLLPFFVLMNLNVWKYAAYVAADTAVYVTLFTFFAYSNTPQADGYFALAAISVLARTATHVWLFAGTLWRARAPPRGGAEVQRRRRRAVLVRQAQ